MPTEVFQGMPDASALNTVTLDGRDGRTTMSVLVEHSSKAHLDGHVDSGTESGMQESYDHLEEAARSLGRLSPAMGHPGGRPPVREPGLGSFITRRDGHPGCGPPCVILPER